MGLLGNNAQLAYECKESDGKVDKCVFYDPNNEDRKASVKVWKNPETGEIEHDIKKTTDTELQSEIKQSLADKYGDSGGEL